MMITDNDDLLAEILLWLPAKSLIRFKLVCKRWFSIISNRRFSHRHTLHHRCRPKLEPSLLLLRLAETSDYFYLQWGGLDDQKWVPFHFFPNPIEPTKLSFSNGLFLLHCRSGRNPLEDCLIYNPTTKQSRKILLNTNDKYRSVMGLNLAFDPSKSPHYQIICVRVTERGSSSMHRNWWRRYQVEVYESESSTWRPCGEPFLAPRDVDFNHGIYWKGGIHWRGISFDLHGSFVGKLPDIVVPGDTSRRNLNDTYIECSGFLHYIAHLTKEKSILVFELQSNYSQWFLKYHIDLERFCAPLSVLSMIRGESEEDSMLVLHEPGKVMAYNFHEKSVKELVDFREAAFYQDRCIQFASLGTFQFIQTLAPI